jgi:hypothetical protein
MAATGHRHVTTLAAEHRPQHFVCATELLGLPALGDEGEDLLNLGMGPSRAPSRADVREVAEGDAEGDGHVIEAVHRDRLVPPLHLAEELSAQARAQTETMLAQTAVLAEAAQSLTEIFADVLHGARRHRIATSPRKSE